MRQRAERNINSQDKDSDFPMFICPPTTLRRRRGGGVKITFPFQYCGPKTNDDRFSKNITPKAIRAEFVSTYKGLWKTQQAIVSFKRLCNQRLHSQICLSKEERNTDFDKALI